MCSQTQLALCHYSTSMDEENFPRPGEFRPDRWIRKDASDRVDNFGSIPFGYGIRSCIGRRIAELEMHLALTQVRVCICVSKVITKQDPKHNGTIVLQIVAIKTH